MIANPAGILARYSASRDRPVTTRCRNIPSVKSRDPAVQPTVVATMKPKVGKKPAARTTKIMEPPAGGLAYGANAWASSRMRRKTAGRPMFATMRAIMRPRRLRSSMTLVVIMPVVGTGDPRRSRE